MSYKAQGRITRLNPIREVSDRFTVREFVLELTDNPEYPQSVEFQVVNKRAHDLDGFSLGDTIAVDFDLRGREWTSPKGEVRVFNKLNVWRVERVGQVAQSQHPGPDADAPADDLPF